MIEVVEYETTGGISPFGRWFASLDNTAAAKVTTAIARMSQGNFGDVKSVGRGISETRISFGPGYRIYFARAGRQLVLLLGGGTKTRQSRDITNAQTAWDDYKRRRKGD